MKDLLGKALYDYITNNNPQPIYTQTNISEEDVLEPSYFFRTYKNMPKIEQKALDLCKGKVLDVGCGAGSHSLYLKSKGLDVLPVDVSALCIETCKVRGLENAWQINVLDISDKSFDTILLLMNGSGIAKTLKNLPHFLKHLKMLLSDSGQILIDSSDLIYMFDTSEDGSYLIPLSSDYYGELTFNLRYKNEEEFPFPWLYVDFNTLKRVCQSIDMHIELVFQGKNFDYLAKITKM